MADSTNDLGTVKPEDIVTNALMMGLNALFGMWESAYKATNGQIPGWDELANRNKILQSRIDAEKEAP